MAVNLLFLHVCLSSSWSLSLFTCCCLCMWFMGRNAEGTSGINAGHGFDLIIISLLFVLFPHVFFHTSTIHFFSGCEPAWAFSSPCEQNGASECHLENSIKHLTHDSEKKKKNILIILDGKTSAGLVLCSIVLYGSYHESWFILVTAGQIFRSIQLTETLILWILQWPTSSSTLNGPEIPNNDLGSTKACNVINVPYCIKDSRGGCIQYVISPSSWWFIFPLLLTQFNNQWCESRFTWSYFHT